jgi:hypothetical protein
MTRIWQKFSVLTCALALAMSAHAQTSPAPPASSGKRPAAKLAKKKSPAKPEPEQPPPPPPTPEQMAPNPPQVRYQQGQLTIVANNSTLGDVLNAVRAQTGANIEVPAGFGGERVMARLGPGPASDVLASLLQGSKLNYIILGDPENPSAIRTVVLTPGRPAAPGGPVLAGTPDPRGPRGPRGPMQRPPFQQRNVQPMPQPDYEEPETAQPEEQVSEVPDETPPSPQPPPTQVPGQPAQQPDSSSQQQPVVKTPEQLLQELRKLKEQERNPTDGEGQQVPDER